MNFAPPTKAPVADLPVHAARVLPIQRRVAFDDDAEETHSGRCACGGECPHCRSALQTKLAISQPGDLHEREADRVADAISASNTGALSGAVIRVVTPYAPASPSAATTADGALMRSGGAWAGGSGHEAIAAQLEHGRSQGQALPVATRERMESGLGTDLSAVRVHCDSGADHMARDLGARAFTHGADIYFRAGEYQPGTRSGDWLIAHELAHVAQQRGWSGVSGHRIQRQTRTFDEAWNGVRNTVRSGATRIGEGVRSGAESIREAAGTVRDMAVDVARSARDLVEGYLEEHAPLLLAFIRGDIVGEIKRRIYQGLDYLFNGLGQRIRTDGLSDTMRDVFGEFVEGVSQIVTDLADGRCESLFAAMRMIGAFGERLTGPVFRELREAAGHVATFFSDLWTQFGSPAVDAIQSLAGSAWTWITTQAQWLWDQTEGVRRWFHDAWEEYKRRFNIAWNDTASILDDLRQRAVTAWEEIKRDLGPWLLPLQVAAGALLLFSPLGPIVAVGVGGYALWQAIGWIRQHWDDIQEMVVTARQYLHDHVLSRIVSDLQWLQGLLERAGEWIGEQATALVNALNSLLEALGLAPMLAAVRRVVGSIVRGLVRAAEFVSTELRRLFADVRRIALEVHRKLRPFYGLIAAVILFPQYPFLLPTVLTGWAWRLSPACIKPPIIDFALDMIIRGVRAVPDFRNFGEAWANAKGHILEALERVRGMSFEEKVAASDRAARVMTGEDIEWIFNLIDAARNAPSHFGEQLEEEVGVTMLDQVLPFERTSEPTREQRRDASIGATAFPVSDADVLSRTRISEDDVVIEQVPEEDMDPALEADLNLADGQETPISGGAGPHAFDELRAELAGAPQADEAAVGGVPESASASVALSTTDDTETRLQAMIDRPLDEACEEGRPAPAATQADFPEALKFGPLTRGQRARFLVAQMGKAFRHWFACNRHWVVPVIILAIATLVGLEILTEGAITAALPAIFDVIAGLFIGFAVVRVTYYLGRYVTLSVMGDVVEGSKSLARGFAAAALELLFALLFNLPAVIRTVRSGVGGTIEAIAGATRRVVTSTVEGVQTLGRTAIRGGRALVGNVRRIAGAALRNGRIAIQGLTRGFSSGARSFRQLLSRLAHLRFRGFSISRQGFTFTLWAHVNPKWPIAVLRARLDQIRAEIATIVEEAEVVLRQGGGTYRRYIDLARSDRDLIAAVLRRNRALLNEARRLRRAGRLDESVLDTFLFRIEGHHAVPMWMGGPGIPYRHPDLLGVVRVLHNFDPSGFHTVLGRVWRESALFGHIAINDGEAVRALFRAAAARQRTRLMAELRRILTATYTETFREGPALQHALAAMDEGLAAFVY